MNHRTRTLQLIIQELVCAQDDCEIRINRPTFLTVTVHQGKYGPFYQSDTSSVNKISNATIQRNKLSQTNSTFDAKLIVRSSGRYFPRRENIYLNHI